MSILETGAFCSAIIYGGFILFLVLMAIAGGFYVAWRILAWCLRSMETDARKAGIKVGSLMLALMFQGCSTKQPKESAYRISGQTVDYRCPIGCIANHSWAVVPHQTTIDICRDAKP
jgi:hypothetical protein